MHTIMRRETRYPEVLLVPGIRREKPSQLAICRHGFRIPDLGSKHVTDTNDKTAGYMTMSVSKARRKEKL